MGKLKLTSRDLAKDTLWLRWAYEGDEIEVETTDGTKRAVWMQDKYCLYI